MAERKINGYNPDSQTQNKILDAATRLIAYKGYHAVSMKDIANEVEIKPAAIYYYYKGKDDLMEDIITRFEKGYRNYLDGYPERR